MSLNSFCFARPDAFLIPVEHLSPTGINSAFATQLQSERDLTPAWVERFDAAWSLAQRRLASLVERAPRHWFPPRRTHVVVATDPSAAHPLHRPLFESASFFYQSDFDPDSSSLELGAFLLIQGERLHLTGDPVGALIASLSYFLELDDDQAADFVEGATRSTRPGVSAYQSLASALPWLRKLFHTQLRPPSQGAPLGELADSGLLVTADDQPRVQALLAEFGKALEAAVEEHYAAHGEGATPQATEGLLDWLEQEAPQLLIVDASDETLWDTAAPADRDALRDALGPLPPALAASIRADLETIDQVTRRFLGAVADPEALPKPTEEIDQADGTYLHQERTLIGYALTQPVWQPLREPAPPYARLALAARVAHEWGHLADEAGLVGVPSGGEEAHAKAKQGVAQAVRDMLAAAPPGFAEAVAHEVKQLDGADPGDYVVEFVLARMPDYRANMIAREVAAPAALETYVRTNVRAHLAEPLPPVRRLAGLSIEFNYLGLIELEDPLDFYLGLCPWPSILLSAGFVKREHLKTLLAEVGRLCACYAIDDDAFRVEADGS